MSSLGALNNLVNISEPDKPHFVPKTSKFRREDFEMFTLK